MPRCTCRGDICDHGPDQCNELAAMNDGFCEPCIAETFIQALARYRENVGARLVNDSPVFLQNS